MKISIIIQNLKCGGCAKTIITNINQLNNITDVQVNNDTSTVSFSVKNFHDALLVRDKLKTLGYPSIEG